MIGQVQNVRYEYKMTADNWMLPYVLSMIRQHPALFYHQYPNRIVNNVYFDTPGYSTYLNHASGAANREKIRVRWYGIPTEVIEKPIMERKIKFGQVGGKLFEPLASLKLDKNGPWPIPGEALSNSKSYKDAMHWRLRSLIPVVALRYERNYFISGDNRFRVTVDSNLEFCGLNPQGIPNNRSILPPPIIIEIKYAPEFEKVAPDVTNNFPFRISRFSKYIYSIEELNSIQFL
jgi:hypothetical protein